MVLDVIYGWTGEFFLRIDRRRKKDVEEKDVLVRQL
jgi:hypothetical protein